jgi:hypothetical protein
MPLPGVSAGTLSISGGAIPAGTTVPFSAGYSYYTTSGTLFTAGQTLTVSASGSTVPAFSSESVAAPALVTLTSPTAAGGYTISTASALSVTWTGGQSGATFQFQGASESGDDSFTCLWNASLGQATVPESILAGLAGTSNGTLSWGQYTTNNFMAGSYAINEQAVLYGSSVANFTP